MHLSCIFCLQDLLTEPFSFKLCNFPAGSNGSPASGSPLAGKLFVVMGAGGAGKALAYGGYEKGARVVVANRTYGESL